MDQIKTMNDPVSLTEEDRRFAMDHDRKITGSFRAEIDGSKAFIAVSVFNIRFFPRGDYIYKILFAASDTAGGKPVYHIAGNISLSPYGKGESSFCINAGDLNGTGLKLADCNYVIIAAMSTLNHDESLHPVLKGAILHDSGDQEDTADHAKSQQHDTIPLSAAPEPENTSADTPRPKDDDPEPSLSTNPLCGSADIGGTDIPGNFPDARSDSDKQIYRQRLNTHAIPASSEMLPPDGSAQPVRSPRAEALHRQHHADSLRDSHLCKISANDTDSADPADITSSGHDSTAVSRMSSHDSNPPADQSQPHPAARSASAESAGSQTRPGDHSSSYSRNVLSKCKDLAENSRGIPKIEPFRCSFAGTSWLRINDISLFPLISPGSKDPVTRYGHFLFGSSGTHYFIGVPGRFLPAEQPDSGRSGFRCWQPLASMPEESKDASIPLEERRRNIYGYWLAAVNNTTGDIEEILGWDRG